MRVLSVFTTVVALLTISLSASAQEKPNVVIMMVDNLGWGEIGTYGGGILRGARTPRLDELASEGMKLLNFNVEPQCTPSRSGVHDGSPPNPLGNDQGRVGHALRHDPVGDNDGGALLRCGLCDRYVR